MIRSSFTTHLDVCPKGVILGRVLLLFAVGGGGGWPGTLYVAKDKGEHFNVWGVCVAGVHSGAQVYFCLYT